MAFEACDDVLVLLELLLELFDVLPLFFELAAVTEPVSPTSTSRQRATCRVMREGRKFFIFSFVT